MNGMAINHHNLSFRILLSINSKFWIIEAKRKQLSIDFHDEQLAILIHPQKEKLDHNYYHYGETIDEHVNRVVLRDLPLSLAHLSESMNGHQFSQIYVVLQHQHSIYFEGMPDKKHSKLALKY